MGFFSGNLADSIFQAQASQIFKEQIEKFKDTHSILVMMMKTIKSHKEKHPFIRTTPNIQGHMLGQSTIMIQISNALETSLKCTYNNTVLTVYHEKAQNF